MSNIRQNINNSNLLSQTNSSILKQILRNKSDKTGWIESAPVTLSFDNGTRTFTITPTGDTFEYWIQGQKFIKSVAETVVIDDTEGLWYIYYILGTLTASQTPWNITPGNKALVAIIHWDATNNIEIGILYELHGYLMHPATHKWAHDTIGTRYEDGLAISLGAGGDLGKVGLTGGQIHDEDIAIVITDGAGGALFEQVLTLPAQIPVFYRSGSAAWRKYTAGDYPFYDNSGGDNIHYNLDTAGSWSSQEASGAAKYIAMWIYATEEQNEPIIAIMGQNESNTVAQARVDNTLDTLSFGTLPTPEMKILFRLILRTDGGSIESLDLRAVSNLPGGTFVPTSHGSLSGLGNDDHTLYLLADGTRAVSGVISHSNQNIDDVASILFDINDGTASEEGRLKWNSTDGTLEVGMPGGNVNIQIGQEELIRVKNETGSTIVNGAAVRINGVSGNAPTIGLSDANDPANAGCIGLATEDILHNAFGYVTTSGMVRDINTLAWSVADRLFVSQTPGELTNIYPSGTDRIILAGIVIKDSETEGMIWVLPINQAHLSELSSVTISSPADNEVLAYDDGSGIWINQTAAEANLSDTSHNHNLNDLAEKNHNSLADKNGGVEFQHMSAAQIAALHATYTNAEADARIAAANHDVLQNPNGNANEQHLTAAQVAALHAVLTNLNQLTTRNHSDLQNKDLEVDIKHLTDAELAALHATYTNAEAVAAINAAGLAIATTKLLAFNDGGSVDIIRDEDNMVSDDPNALATQQSIKAFLDAFIVQYLIDHIVGEGNKVYRTLKEEAELTQTTIKYEASAAYRNFIPANSYLTFGIDLPLTKTVNGITYDLHIDRIRFGLDDADANDKVASLTIYKWTDYTTAVIAMTDATGWTTIDEHDVDFADVDLAGVKRSHILVFFNTTTSRELEFSYIRIRYWYDN